MRLQPPFTETNLQKEECKAYQQADGITAIRGQIQREREINNNSGNRLGDVVRQTHLTIKPQIGCQLPEFLRLI